MKQKVFVALTAVMFASHDGLVLAEVYGPTQDEIDAYVDAENVKRAHLRGCSLKKENADKVLVQYATEEKVGDTYGRVRVFVPEN